MKCDNILIIVMFAKRLSKQNSGEKSFRCDACKKSFGRKDHLTQHMLVHSGNNDFQYQVWGKYFAQKAYLKPHLVTQTQEKYFKREICENVLL